MARKKRTPPGKKAAKKKAPKKIGTWRQEFNRYRKKALNLGGFDYQEAEDIASETTAALWLKYDEVAEEKRRAFLERTFWNRFNKALSKKYPGKAKKGAQAGHGGDAPGDGASKKLSFVEATDENLGPVQPAGETPETVLQSNETVDYGNPRSERERCKAALHLLAAFHHVGRLGKPTKKKNKPNGEVEIVVPDSLRMGRTLIVAGKPAEIDLGSVEYMVAFVTRGIRHAPVDAKTQTRAWKDFLALMRVAFEQSGVLSEDMEIEPDDKIVEGPELTINDDHMLDDNERDLVALLLTLYPSLDDLDLMSHVKEQAAELDDGDTEDDTSLLWFVYEDDDDEDLWIPGGLMTQLHRLWRDADGDPACMTLTSGERLGPGFCIHSCDGQLALVPPLSDDPDNAVARTPEREARLRDLGYRPHAEDDRVWVLRRSPRSKDDLAPLLNRVKKTLARVYDFDFDQEDVEFLGEYGTKEQKIMTPKSLPTTGKVNLHSFAKMLSTDRVLETFFDDDFDEEPPSAPDDSKPARTIQVEAAHLWRLLAVAVEGAVEDPELEEWDDEDIDEETLDYYLERLDEFLNNRVFVSLLRRDPDTAVYVFWWGVVEQPYTVVDGELMFTLPDEEE